MISNLDILMPVIKLLPKDKYPSNPGLKSSTLGPLIPRVGYLDLRHTLTGVVHNRSVAHFTDVTLLHEVWIITDVWLNLLMAPCYMRCVELQMCGQMSPVWADKDNLMWLQNGKQVHQFPQHRFSKTAFFHNLLENIS